MSSSQDFNRANGVKLLHLILSLHRKRLVDIPDAGYTDDILLLLRLANGDAELMAWATSSTSAAAEELRVSCVAFIERICFGKDADPFSVLGLNPWANTDAVKEHYRLLIRIFHPDRGQVDGKVAEAYSARINQAYALLKQQVTDSSIDLPKHSNAGYRAQPAVMPRRFAKPVGIENNGSDSLRWASGLTPARVLFGMALLAGLIIYLSFPQKMRMQPWGASTVEEPLAMMPADRFTPGPGVAASEPPPLPDEIVKDIPVEVMPTPVEVEAAAPEQLPVEVKPVNLETPPLVKKHMVKAAQATVVAEKKAKPADIKYADAKPDNKAAVVQPVAVAAPPGNSLPSTVVPQVNKKNALTAPDAARLPEASERAELVKVADAPTDRELHDLIASFMNNYANGDINAFMQIFDEQVRSDESGGKRGLSSAYADFFAKTASRSIVLKDLQWKKQGALAIAFADYRATTLRTGESKDSTSSGKLQIEVAKTGSRAMISGFFYQEAKK
ncbi:J domain-containing protein [Methylotenera sp. G11]|uniref:J domain-containing protein n=1 Tax=Methylotenera sp. G11 TaxID=1506585 RepID=UPI000647E7BA|nr:J domain-containing protein [Methylotenera sp. G11]